MSTLWIPHDGINVPKVEGMDAKFIFRRMEIARSTPERKHERAQFWARGRYFRKDDGLVVTDDPILITFLIMALIQHTGSEEIRLFFPDMLHETMDEWFFHLDLWHYGRKNHVPNHAEGEDEVLQDNPAAQ